MEDLLGELNEIPALRAKLMDTMFERTLNYMQHFLSFIRDTPQQRYENLVANHPYIIQRVPQHYIASYLGISRVHLSRIRNKLARGNA